MKQRFEGTVKIGKMGTNITPIILHARVTLNLPEDRGTPSQSLIEAALKASLIDAVRAGTVTNVKEITNDRFET